MRQLILTMVWCCLVSVGLLGCVDGLGGCPGEICSGCGAYGDCPDLDCPPGEVLYCGHFGYFDDPDLRCTFCGPPDLEL